MPNLATDPDSAHRTGAWRTVIRRTPERPRAQEGFVFPRAAARDLARDLAAKVAGEVRFGDGDRALYATDASNYRQTPIGLVVPRTVEDVVATIELCRRYDAPVTARGGGTSLAGEACNTAVIIDFSKHLNRVLHIDAERRLAEVEPGCVLDVLRGEAERHGLTFGPDPATHSRNSLGGMIGNDSCGVHSVMAGRTADNVRGLEVLTYDGLRMAVGPTAETEFEAILAEGGRRAELYRGMREIWAAYGPALERAYPAIPRRVSGYENLDQLSPAKGMNVARALVGTEGGCAIVLRATLELVPSPPHRVLAVLGFPDIFRAADAVCAVLEHAPIGLEGMDDLLISYMRRQGLHAKDLALLPQGQGWLMAEFGGETPEIATGRAQGLAAQLGRRGVTAKVLASADEQHRLWRVREAGLAATAHVPGLGETSPGWEDSAVRREDLGRYLRDLKALFTRYGYEAAVYGHFGDGLVHCRINFDLRTEAGLRIWQAFLEEAADLVVRYGGSLSGEHGDGQARGALLERMYGPEAMAAQRAFKALWDPQGRMNPGKVLDPYPVTSNLRLGPEHRPPHIPGRFAYPQDHGDFARATERCVGVGACRRLEPEGEVMCPSFLATREEKHSTRGRARLLFEMVHGDPLTEGWKSEAVESALDLCLACKGCKRDCPVHVDMATYKAEFRARHYEGRLRPRSAYAMGQIRRWAELGAKAPWLANAVTGSPGLSRLAKLAGGVAPPRRIPALARRSFTQQFRQRPPRPPTGRRVLLWPDTFNEFFRPQTALAAVRVLEAFGLEVAIPAVPLCCGRPLYDWGWLEQAKALWRRTFAALGPEIEAGVPVVGLEPACVSAFRDEAPALFPGDPMAERLSRQTFFLTEFLDGLDRPPPRIAADALTQVHCHHHAVLDAEAEARVLQAAGVRARRLDTGCCGMAGAFGFEAAKYEVSQAIADRTLFPAVREAPPETLILANGYSCREQIEQGTGRPTLHVAELLARGLS